MREPRQLRAVPPPVAGRVPPNDLDAEAAVLSAILLDAAAIDAVADMLKPEHFYSSANGRIYEAAVALSAAGSPIDITLVAAYLRDRERLPQCGGAAYLIQIADATPSVSHIEAHARVVIAKYRQRSLIASCQRIAAEGYGDVGELQAWIDGAESEVHAIARTSETVSMQPVSEVLTAAFTQITAAAERGDRIVGASTGFDRLDAMTGGFESGKLWIIAGRPGMGKTSLATCAAMNVAWPKEGQRPTLGVGIFSLEMTKIEMATRMACAEARVDLSKIRQGFLQPDDWRRLTEAASGISALPIHIDATEGLSPMALRSKVRRLRSEYARIGVSLALVVVDHVGLMRAELGPNASREQEVGECSRSLKELAKECDTTVLELVQLNRGLEARNVKNKRPAISDMRDSGRLEEDADTVLLVYRDEYYNPESTNAKGIAEVIIGKQRSGPTGKVLMRFSPSCTRFDNLAPNDYPEVTDE